MADKRRPIPPNPPRWQPSSDPASIQVPGLDSSASVLDQIEQMEQLITIKLQNIDENFSKIHHLLANKLLPAVKRYAVGTEPVREAAKFWTSFYEQAAQIHIPTYDDYSTVNDLSSEREHSETEPPNQSQDQTAQSQRYESGMTTIETSFMPSQAAFSSTPATARVAQTLSSFDSRISDDTSWAASMESPLVRLDRELQEFSKEEDEYTLEPSTSQQISSSRLDEHNSSVRHPEPSMQLRSEKGKGKGKEAAQPLLRNVLRHNLHSINDASTSDSALKKLSPLKHRGKPKTPIPKKYNPYLSPETDPADWNGVVDLRDPSARTPDRFSRTRALHRNLTTPIKEDDNDEDSFDGLPPGMSPPVLMSPARPPRSSAELGLLKLGQTPTKEATARITRNLVTDFQYKSGGQARHMYGYANSGVESSMSTVPTPPSLSRYNRQDTTDSIAMDSSFESMMRRVGLNVPSSIGTASTPGLRLRSKAALSTAAQPRQPTPQLDPEPGEPTTPTSAHADLDADSDSDSFDEVNNTAHPSAAFMMASSRGHNDSDDSFGSSDRSGDSLTEEGGNLGIAPVHPFALGVEDDGFDDDSFEDDIYDRNAMGETEETLFGVPPGQRIHADAQMRASGHHLGDGLRMLGEDLLQETIGIGTQIALSGRVEESPTPASWGGRS